MPEIEFAAAKMIADRAVIVGATTENIPSPCSSVCTMNTRTQWCSGCFRTIEEVAAWSVMPDREKMEVWRALAERAGSITAQGKPTTR